MPTTIERLLRDPDPLTLESLEVIEREIKRRKDYLALALFVARVWEREPEHMMHLAEVVHWMALQGDDLYHLRILRIFFECAKALRNFRLVRCATERLRTTYWSRPEKVDIDFGAGELDITLADPNKELPFQWSLYTRLLSPAGGQRSGFRATPSVRRAAVAIYEAGQALSLSDLMKAVFKHYRGPRPEATRQVWRDLNQAIRRGAYLRSTEDERVEIHPEWVPWTSLFFQTRVLPGDPFVLPDPVPPLLNVYAPCLLTWPEPVGGSMRGTLGGLMITNVQTEVEAVEAMVESISRAIDNDILTNLFEDNDRLVNTLPGVADD